MLLSCCLLLIEGLKQKYFNVIVMYVPIVKEAILHYVSMVCFICD